MTDSEPTYANFGEYIQMLRLERRLSLVKAAKRMGFSSQKLCDIEQGRRYKKKVTLNLLTSIANAYKVPIAEIIRQTSTAITHDKTVTEIVNELIPKVRFADLLADSLKTESRQYAPEIESKAVELFTTIRECRGLLSLLRKRHLKTESAEEEEETNDHV